MKELQQPAVAHWRTVLSVHTNRSISHILTTIERILELSRNMIGQLIVTQASDWLKSWSRALDISRKGCLSCAQHLVQAAWAAPVGLVKHF